MSSARYVRLGTSSTAREDLLVLSRKSARPNDASGGSTGPHSTIVIAGDTTTLFQAGVIAYRLRHGRVQVLLMTSRDTGRWIIPKGNIKPGTTPSKAAEQEAFEEAGIKGTIASSTPLGMYTYSKTLGSGEARGATVEVYLLKVERQVKNWPERQERKLAWVSAKKAVSRVEEPGVVPLLLRLVEIAGDLS